MSSFLGIDFGHREYVDHISYTTLGTYDYTAIKRFYRQRRVNYIETDDEEAYMLSKQTLKRKLLKPFKLKNIERENLDLVGGSIRSYDTSDIDNRVAALLGLSIYDFDLIEASLFQYLDIKGLLYKRFNNFFAVPSALGDPQDFRYSYDEDCFYYGYTKMSYYVNMTYSPYRNQKLSDPLRTFNDLYDEDGNVIPQLDDYGHPLSRTHYEKCDFGWLELTLSSNWFSARVSFTVADILLGNRAMYKSNLIEALNGYSVLFSRRLAPLKYDTFVVRLKGSDRLRFITEHSYPDRYTGVQVQLEAMLPKFYPIVKLNSKTLAEDPKVLSDTLDALPNYAVLDSARRAIEKSLNEIKNQEKLLDFFNTTREAVQGFIQQDDKTDIFVTRAFPLADLNGTEAKFLYNFFRPFKNSPTYPTGVRLEAYPQQAISDYFSTVMDSYFRTASKSNLGYIAPQTELLFDIDDKYTIGLAFNKTVKTVPSTADDRVLYEAVVKGDAGTYKSILRTFIIAQYKQIVNIITPSEYIDNAFKVTDYFLRYKDSIGPNRTEGDYSTHQGYISYSDTNKILDILMVEAILLRRRGNDDTVRQDALFAFVAYMESLGGRLLDDPDYTPSDLYKPIRYSTPEQRAYKIKEAMQIKYINSPTGKEYYSIPLYSNIVVTNVSVVDTSEYYVEVKEPLMSIDEAISSLESNYVLDGLNALYGVDFERDFINLATQGLVKLDEYDSIEELVEDNKGSPAIMDMIKRATGVQINIFYKDNYGSKQVIELFNITQRLYINDRVKSSKRFTDPSQANFALPLDIVALESTIKDFDLDGIARLGTTSSTVISTFTSSYYVKWYQEDWVGTAIQVIGFIVMVATAGAGTPIVEIVKQIAIQVIIQQLAMMVAERIGGQFGAILGAVVIAAGSVYNPATGSYDFIKAISSVELWSKFSSAYLGFNNKVMLEESRHVIEALKVDIETLSRKTLELQEKDKALDDSNMVNILEIPTLQRPSFNYNINIVDEEQYGALDNRISIDDELFEVQDFMDRALLE